MSGIRKPPAAGPIEQLRIDRVLCAAFGKLPGESLADAATRTLSSPYANVRTKWAAKTLLRQTGPARDPWGALEAAARILEGGASS